MSTLPCGCDYEANYTCRDCRERALAAEASVDAFRLFHAEALRIANEAATITSNSRGAGVYIAPHPEPEPTPLDESLIDTQRIAHLLVAQVQELSKRVEQQTEDLAVVRRERDAMVDRYNAAATEHMVWRKERQRIAETLARFHSATLSMSSVQPLLTLAEDLNPSLKR